MAGDVIDDRNKAITVTSFVMHVLLQYIRGHSDLSRTSLPHEVACFNRQLAPISDPLKGRYGYARSISVSTRYPGRVTRWGACQRRTRRTSSQAWLYRRSG